MRDDQLSLVIRIDAEESKFSALDSIFEKKEATDTAFWEFSISSALLKDAFDLLYRKLDRLKELKIEKSDISLWIFYEYKDQCNFELSVQDIKYLFELGIAFCISCWESK